jgi:hypothetical protein
LVSGAGFHNVKKVVVSEFVTLDGVVEDPSWTFQFKPSEDYLKVKTALPWRFQPE